MLWLLGKKDEVMCKFSLQRGLSFAFIIPHPTPHPNSLTAPPPCPLVGRGLPCRNAEPSVSFFPLAQIMKSRMSLGEGGREKEDEGWGKEEAGKGVNRGEKEQVEGRRRGRQRKGPERHSGPG